MPNRFKPNTILVSHVLTYRHCPTRVSNNRSRYPPVVTAKNTDLPQGAKILTAITAVVGIIKTVNDFLKLYAAYFFIGVSGFACSNVDFKMINIGEAILEINIHRVRRIVAIAGVIFVLIKIQFTR